MSDILNEIEELAKLPEFTPKDIGRVVGIDDQLITGDDDTPEKLAYLRGKLIEKAEHNKRVNQLVKAGSGPAQILAVRMRRDAEFERLRQHYG
jgi:hypothetical protein